MTPAGTQDGLGDEGGDGLRTLAEDQSSRFATMRSQNWASVSPTRPSR